MAQGIDQVAGGGEVPHRLGDERLAQCQAILGRTAVADPAVAGQMPAGIADFANGHELAVLLIEWAQFIFQEGEEAGLNGMPDVA